MTQRLFTNHIGLVNKRPMKLLNLQPDIIYGPVHSRRLGRSLGINLLPTTFKLCSFNCCYCQYGWTSKLTNDGSQFLRFLPSVKDVGLVLGSVLRRPNHFDYITFSGNGEPTLHPEFPQIIDMVLELKAYLMSDAKTAVLSNGSRCGDPSIRDALAKIELPIMKLDVGNERAFRKINACIKTISFGDIVDGLKSLDRFVIQTMFVGGAFDNSSEEEVASWIETLQELQPRPRWVQIYSLDRGTPTANVRRVPPDRLYEIADLARQKTGLEIDVF